MVAVSALQSSHTLRALHRRIVKSLRRAQDLSGNRPVWITKSQRTAIHWARLTILEQQAADQNRSPRNGSRILQATISLYREIGYGKTTVADIARRCAMSPANVYRFFRSKRDIEETVVAELLEQVFQEASNVAGCSGSPLHRLEAVLRRISQLHEAWLANDNRLHDLVSAASNAGWPVVLSYVDRVVSLLAPIISAGQASGDIRDGSAATLARCLLAAMNAHVSAREVSAAAVRPNFDEMIEFCINSLCQTGCRTVRRSVGQS